MSVILDKLKKRLAYPVQGLEGVFVRLLTIGEKAEQLAVNQADRREQKRLQQMLATNPDDVESREALERLDAIGTSHFFSLGLILSNADGTAVIPRSDGESAADYAAKVSGALTDVDEITMKKIGQAYADLVKNGEPQTVKQLETIAKN